MKPVAFELEAVHSIDEALEHLSRNGRDVKLLAGGQSLMPLLNFRLARPDVLVDLNRVAELQYIRFDAGGLALGAMTRQRALERSPEVAQVAPLLAEALPWVAHAPIRNRGTLGGTLAHADSAAELCAVALALDMSIVARGRAGERTLAANEFFVGPFTSALAADELLVEVRVPPCGPGSGWAFEEVARRQGDFAMVGVAAVVRLDAAETIADARLAYASMGPTPLRARAAEALLRGQRPAAELFDSAAEQAMGELDPGEDLHASREYRLHVGRALTRRALARAVASAGDRAVGV